MYKDRITGLLRYFSAVLEMIKQFNLAADRVFEIIDDDCFKKEKFGNQVIEKVNGDFEFRNVTFGYDEERIILNNLSFKIKANETVSFVGKSGAGKSTIFSLIDKLYKQKKVVNPLKCKCDKHLKRKLWLFIRDINYNKKYKRNEW